jgi:hypothetical protein
MRVCHHFPKPPQYRYQTGAARPDTYRRAGMCANLGNDALAGRPRTMYSGSRGPAFIPEQVPLDQPRHVDSMAAAVLLENVLATESN